MLVRLYKWTSDQASDVASIIFFIISHRLRALKLFFFIFIKLEKIEINWNDFCKEFCKKLWKKISLGTSDTWSLVLLYKRTSVQSYSIIDGRILNPFCLFVFVDTFNKTLFKIMILFHFYFVANGKIFLTFSWWLLFYIFSFCCNVLTSQTLTSHVFWTFLTYLVLPTLSYSITSHLETYLRPPYLP